jgi:hypothetical protein
MKKNLKRIIFLDVSQQVRTGHYNYWRDLIQKSLLESGIQLDIPSYSNFLSENNLSISQSSSYDENRYARLSFVKDVLKKDPVTRHIFFIWLTDFESYLDDLDKCCQESNVTFSGLGRISNAIRRINSNEKVDYKDYHPELLQSIKSSKNLKNYFYWDAFLEGRIPTEIQNRVSAMPDLQDTTISDLRPNADFDLGFYGHLRPSRGLFEFLLIALFNPNKKFYISGRLDRTSITRREYLIFKVFSFLQNIEINTQYFEKDSQLNLEICRSKKIYLSGRRHLESSGILYKAAHLRVPVLASSGDSFIEDFIKKTSFGTIIQFPRYSQAWRKNLAAIIYWVKGLMEASRTLDHVSQWDGQILDSFLPQYESIVTLLWKDTQYEE